MTKQEINEAMIECKKGRILAAKLSRDLQSLWRKLYLLELEAEK